MPSWYQINIYASQMSGEEELIKRAKMSMEIIDEVFSSDDEDNLPQPTEIEDEPAMIEEAANVTTANVALGKSSQSIKPYPTLEAVTTQPSKEEDLSLEG